MTLNGVALSCDQEVPRGETRREIRRGEVLLETVAEAGDPSRGREVIHLVRASGTTLLLLAQQGRTAVFQAPTTAQALKLFAPVVRLPGAFPSRPDGPVALTAETDDHHLRLSAAHDGGRRVVELTLSPAYGWTLLFPIPMAPGAPLRIAAAIWLGALLLPAGYWAGLAARPAGAVGALGAVVIAGLGLVPALAGFDPAHWSEWVGAGGGVAARLGPLPNRGLSSEPMRLSFHQRILLILICLGAIPTAAAILGWGLTIRTATPGAGPREALEEVGATGRALLRALDSTDLSPAGARRPRGARGHAQQRASGGSSGRRPTVATTMPASASRCSCLARRRCTRRCGSAATCRAN